MCDESVCDAYTSLQTGIKLDSTNTFKWIIENFNRIYDNSSLICDQKIDVKVEATPALPAMTLTLSLSHESSRGCTFLNLDYVCNTEESRPIPTYEATLSYFKKDGTPFNSNTVLQNTPKGSWRIGSKEGDGPWDLFVRQWSGGNICLEITLDFYRNLTQEGLRLPGVSWNKHHEHSKKAELLEMLNSGRLSDVKVVSSDEQEFPAHKFVLKAGSEVFEAMFRHQMAESATGVITLNDLSSRAVKFLLHFLYSSEILPISTDEDDKTGKDATFEEVFYLASKYGLKELATHLEEDVGNYCKEENVIYLLRLCKLYSLEKGKEAIFDMVRKNRWNVLNDFVISQL